MCLDLASRLRLRFRYCRGVALGGEAGEEAFLRVSGGGFAIVSSDGGTAGDGPGTALVREVENYSYDTGDEDLQERDRHIAC